MLSRVNMDTLSCLAKVQTQNWSAFGFWRKSLNIGTRIPKTSSPECFMRSLSILFTEIFVSHRIIMQEYSWILFQMSVSTHEQIFVIAVIIFFSLRSSCFEFLISGQRGAFAFAWSTLIVGACGCTVVLPTKCLRMGSTLYFALCGYPMMLWLDKPCNSDCCLNCIYYNMNSGRWKSGGWIWRPSHAFPTRIS